MFIMAILFSVILTLNLTVTLSGNGPVLLAIFGHEALITFFVTKALVMLQMFTIPKQGSARSLSLTPALLLLVK
jgi:hypothetical protein